LVEDMRRHAAQIFEPTKDLIIKGCWLVLMADGVVQDAESALMNRIAHALSVSDERRERLIDSIGPGGSISNDA
jgi:uncharacterized tellurite resistance protein B-like protein